VWQALRTEIHAKGAEVVTVALDTGGVDAAGPWIDKAEPDHPSLIDEAHVTAELFGFVNVPNAVWIDEDGMLVRPSHPAHIRQSPLREMEVPEGLGRLGEVLTEVKKIRTDVETYRAAITDWVDNGAASRWALSPDEVVARSRPRPPEHAEAAACFDLAQHLWRQGEHDAAVRWFKEAHRLHPDNWTYKRQAWTFVTTAPGEPSDLLQGPNDVYEGNWLDDVRAVGAEHYYEPFEH
jgi:tetratricopeptide (TPR) repeat protein